MRRSVRRDAGASRAGHCCPACASMSHCRSRASWLARYEFTCLTSLLGHGRCVMDRGWDGPAGPGDHFCGQQIKGSQGCFAAVAGAGPGRTRWRSSARAWITSRRWGGSWLAAPAAAATTAHRAGSARVPSRRSRQVPSLVKLNCWSRIYSVVASAAIPRCGDRRGLHLPGRDCAGRAPPAAACPAASVRLAAAAAAARTAAKPGTAPGR
jgi:hypothetical protein